MSGNNSRAIISNENVQELQEASSDDLRFSIILQGEFDSDAAREGFVKAFSKNGLEILQGGHFRINPPPSNDSSGVMGKLSRAFSEPLALRLRRKKQS